MSNKLHHGDCLEVMPTLDADSIDSIVSDPPYGLSFMGKGWDHGVPSVEFWSEALRVAKPGAHLLAFGGTRTFHRLTVAIEDAGWEIRDCVMWVYGSGFPKSHDVSKAIDKAAGAEREVVGQAKSGIAKGDTTFGDDNWAGKNRTVYGLTAPATDAAKQWEGWGTALKPAWEPIIVARKPLIGTVAANVLAHGTGGINVDGCRVGTDELKGKVYNNNNTGWKCTSAPSTIYGNEQGRWPANLIHDGSDDVTAGFPNAGGGFGKRGALNGGATSWGFKGEMQEVAYGDSGSAARFFYCAKASKADRDEGCEGMELRLPVDGADKLTEQDRRKGEGITRQPSRNNHPTVKPTALMRYLCKLVTPLNGIILDPFMGSGSTGKAATLEGFNFIGIDLSAEYVAIAQARIDAATKQIAEQLQYGSS